MNKLRRLLCYIVGHNFRTVEWFVRYDGYGSLQAVEEVYRQCSRCEHHE